MDDLIKHLKNLNLTDKEARVYLALLELGPSTPYKIAKRSRLKRPTAYVIAEELLEKGLVVQVSGEKNKLYIAKSPEAYFEETEHRFRAAKEILPELIALQQKTSDKPKTLFFEGLEGMRQGLWYKEKELRGKEVVGFFASAKQANKEVGELFDEWNAHYIQHGISVRGISDYDESLDELFGKYLKSHLKNVRFLPKNSYRANASIEVCNDFVRVDLIGARQVIIIESREFALVIKQIFEIVWNSNITFSYEEAVADYNRSKMTANTTS